MASILDSQHDDRPDVDEDETEDTTRHLIGRRRMADASGTERTFTVWGARPKGERPDLGYLTTIWVAGILLTALAGATMYVSFEAQYSYIEQFKTDDLAVLLEALSWDVAAFAFATLGLATALRGRSALAARIGNLACVAVSVLMNSAQALAPDGATDWGSLLVWAGPPLLYAGVSDRIIVEIQNRMVQRRNLDAGHTLWSVLGLALWSAVGVLAWLLRLLLAPKSTVTGFRGWYIDEVAYAPGRTVAGDRARKAELTAASAEQIAERVRVESATAIAAADTRADEAIAAMRAEYERQTTEYRQAEAARVAELEAEHARQMNMLRGELEQVREQSEQSLSGVRAELEAQHSRQMDALRSELEASRREVKRLSDQNQTLTNTLALAQDSASGRARVELLYEDLGHRGDPRYGSGDIDSVAEELAAQTQLDIKTVRRYLREHLAKKGQDGGRGTSVNGAMIGGIR